MKSKVFAVAVALSLGVTILSSSPAHSVAVLAVPGSFLAGYATSTAAADPAAPMEFVNLDLAEHSVVSTAYGPNTNPWCARYFYAAGKCPLFRSDDTAAGGASAIAGIAALHAGSSYTFFCAQHPSTMRGTLTVQ